MGAANRGAANRQTVSVIIVERRSIKVRSVFIVKSMVWAFQTDGRSRKRKVIRDFSPVGTQPLYDVECAMFRVDMITRLP
jgi:hypothetical protein